MNHDDIDGDIYKDKKSEWLDYVKQDVLGTVLFMLDILKQWNKKLDLV